ncbi:MAG: PAS domain S-box protein [Anaerolineae bacterium]
MMIAATPEGPPDFLAGGSEMGELIREMDWSQTPLGPVATWPQSLRTTVSVCLSSRFPILLWWGPDLIMLYNDAYRPMLGTKHPRALGAPGREIWPEIWDIIGPMLTGVVSRGEATWSDDLLLVLERNGYPEECYFTFSYSPIRDESGGVGGVFTAVHETTQRVIGERRLQTLRELASESSKAMTEAEAGALSLDALAHNPIDLPFALLYLLDTDGQTVRLAGTTGLPVDSPLAVQVIDLDASIDDSDVWCLSDVFTSGKPRLAENLSERFGALRLGAWPDSPPTQAIVLPLTTSSAGRASGCLILGLNARRAFDDDYKGFCDLVARHVETAIANARAYEEERARAAALAELDRAKTAFFSNVSHEFRTPLTLILGPLEDAFTQATAPEQRERLELIHRNALRLQRLVNTLLDFSRIEANRIQAVYEPTDLAALTRDLASVFRSAVERAGLRFIVDCPPLPAPVYVDREMWEKIVLNLLSNAFKFTMRGEIAVRVQAADGAALLSVSDTGTGIPAGDLPHIFERFHRADSTQARTHEGTGIGLALVQELVRLHGGSISVQSEEGLGSTFTVSIPTGVAHLPADRVGADPRSAATALTAEHYLDEALRWLPDELPSRAEIDRTPEAPIRESVDGEPRPRIVWADDNADMREYVSRLLAPLYDVETVPDGASALEAVRRKIPDLVLADIMMPRMDGFELLSALRGDDSTRAIPVLLLSARAGEEARVEGLQAGADDYLVKPFTARELLARVQAQLERARAAAALARQQELLQTIIDRIPVMITMYDPEARLLWLNSEFERIVGWSSRDAAGISLMEECYPDPQYREEVSEHMHVGQGGWMDIRMRTRDGRDIETSWANVRLSDQTQVGIGIDITERKQAEQAIRERDIMLRAAMDAGKLGAWVWDIPANQVTWTNNIYEFHGLEPGTFGGTVEDFAALVYPPDLPGVRAALDRSLTEQVPYEREFRTVRPDGEMRWLYTRAEVFTDAAGSPGRMIGVTQDITERRQSEEALRQSQSRLAAAMQIAQLGIWEYDPVGEVTYWDARCHEIFGVSESHPMSDTEVFALIHPDDRARVGQQVSSALAPGGNGQYATEYRIVRRDGTQRWVAVRGNAVATGEDEAGGPARFVGTVMDITENREIEERLRVSEERFRGTFENAAVGMSHVSLDGRWLNMNDKLCEITGYSREELLNLTFQEITHPDDLAEDLEYLRQMLAGQRQMYSMEKRYIHKRGHTVWVTLTVSLLHKPDGAPDQLIAVVQDITLRKRAEATAQRQGRLIELSYEPIFVWDFERGIVEWNAGAERLYGFSAAEAIGQISHDLLHTIHPMPYAEFQRTFEQRKTWSGELRQVAKDGRGVIVASRQQIIEVDGRQLVLETNRDITEQKRAEEALREADRRKDEFLATLAHELRNPLAPVRNAVQILKLQDSLDPSSQAARDIIDRQVQHMVRLIDDLLDISRITQDKLELRKESVELASVLFQALETSQPHIERDGHEITVSLPSEPVYLDADPVRLAQVFSNLLNNATRYTPPGGQIWLTAERHDREVIVSVKDTGAGIPTDKLGTIFDLFAQLDRPPEQARSGLGIGLTLVKRLVEMHGGSVAAYSDGPGQGSEFVVCLPVLDGPPGVDAAPPATTAVNGATHLRVLVVDDNVDIVESLMELMEIEGHTARAAHDGLEAVAVAEEFRPDVVLLDIDLPRIDGYEACRRIREQFWGKRMTLVALTGWGQKEARRRSHEAGFDYHLVKPVDLAELMSLLAMLPTEESHRTKP